MSDRPSAEAVLGPFAVAIGQPTIDRLNALLAEHDRDIVLLLRIISAKDTLLAAHRTGTQRYVGKALNYLDDVRADYKRIVEEYRP